MGDTPTPPASSGPFGPPGYLPSYLNLAGRRFIVGDTPGLKRPLWATWVPAHTPLLWQLAITFLSIEEPMPVAE